MTVNQEGEAPRVTVHAGLPKTASTYLQRFWFSRASSGRYIKKPEFRELVHGLSDEKASLLVSDESLSAHTQEADGGGGLRARRLDVLATLLGDAQLLMFLREPSRLLASLYVQHIYRGEVRSFEEWLEEFREVGHYRPLLEAIQKQPWRACLLFDQAQLKAEEDKVVGAIERFTAMRFDGPQRTDKPISGNVGLARSGARTLRWANRIKNRSAHQRSRVHTLSSALRVKPLCKLNEVGGPVVPADVCHELEKYFAEEWRWTQEVIRESQLRVLPDSTRPNPLLSAGG